MQMWLLCAPGQPSIVVAIFESKSNAEAYQATLPPGAVELREIWLAQFDLVTRTPVVL